MQLKIPKARQAMVERALTQKNSLFIIFLVIPLSIYCLLFIYSNLRADFFYDKALSLREPTAVQEMEKHYRANLAFISAAIKFSKKNPDYLAAKADSLFTVMEAGLKGQLPVRDSEIEYLYKRAIKLNPVNFEYHLKLGWFYLGRNDQKAKEELIKATELYPADINVYRYLTKYYFLKRDKEELTRAAELYPKDPENYLYLAKCYFAEGADKAAFSNLLLFLHYEHREETRHAAMKELTEQIKPLPQFVSNWEAKVIRFIVYPEGPEFNFKKENFPHERIPLKFMIYTEDSQAEVSFYRGSLFYALAAKTTSTPEYTAHWLDLNNYPSESYLDDFKIRVKPPSSIIKIEIIKYF